MKVKRPIFSGAALLAVLLVANSSLADGTAKPAITSKPYNAPLNTNLPKDVSSDLPELGDNSQTVLTPLEEQRIGEQIMRDVMTSDDVVQDVEVVDYVQNLGNRLVAASEAKDQQFNFFVVKDSSINAFAMPGGVVGVHTGLIASANSESELASVLGHEIGHVTQHHLARMLAQQKIDTFKNIAGIAAAILLARANPDLATGALTTATAAGVQRELDYTREHEREADRVGLNVMQNAGFDPRAMSAFFSTLQRNTRFIDGTAPSFLRTHPLTVERIADMQNRVDGMPYRQVTDSFDYQLVRAKLRATTGLAGDSTALFRANIKEHRYANEAAEHYGLAVALLRKNDMTGAAAEVKWLRTNAPKNPFIETLAAKFEVARNNPQAAAQQYAAGLALFPNYRALIDGYAELFLSTNQPDKAISFVQSKLTVYPKDGDLYDLLAKAYNLKGKQLLRYQAQGEAYYRKYNLPRAVEQMELATKATDGSFYEKSIVEARLKELQRLQKNEKPT